MGRHRSYNFTVNRWTSTAIDCYKRGCVCKGCPIYEQFFQNTHEKCQMKRAVLESVRLFGAPKEEDK